ncbi:MAG: YidC/Oxa1 family insertase periplasmic-domain containing protein [Kiritimatiellia bacterium]
MNRSEKLIVAMLFVALLAWLWYTQDTASKAQQQALAERQAAAVLSTNAAAQATLAPATNQPVAGIPAAAVVAEPPPPDSMRTAHLLPEETNVLRSADMDLMISSRGATLRAATLPAYRARSEKNSGPVILDFDPQPALALSGLPDVPPDADYSVRAGPSNTLNLVFVTPQGLRVERTVALREHHRVLVTDRITNTSEIPLKIGTNWVALGTFYRGNSKNDELSADSFAVGPEDKVRHWSSELPKLFGISSFGCGGSGGAVPSAAMQTVTGAQHWVALKSRFFVQTFAPSVASTAFRLEAAHDANQPVFALSHVNGAVAFPGALLEKEQGLERSYELYIGPKKLAYLTELGLRRNEIMEFGFFSWFCKPLVPLLNFFYRIIPNYGVAIILLTLLVRIVFWPLTHKSTESAKRMRDVQPKIKAIQEQFKDEPHKLQQEIWKVYRENKVNPFSSCLPMLVQLPVFIALYTVLRSAVELRFAPFIWVSDLSEPENLFAGVVPPLVLNILPLVMAAVTIVQSKLTPAMGDPMQQKMMTWMMPLMMLFFFYSMPSALSLYWTVSTILAIGQLWWQQRTPKDEAAAALAATDPEKMTRQMRRRMER